MTMVKYVFAVAASILGVIKPAIHTNPSHWLSKQISSDLHLALGVSIGLEQKPYQNKTASNYYGEQNMFFAIAASFLKL